MFIFKIEEGKLSYIRGFHDQQTLLAQMGQTFTRLTSPPIEGVTN